jgi:hypothetical protein
MTSTPTVSTVAPSDGQRTGLALQFHLVLACLQRLLSDSQVQRAILVAVIVWVFWDGIWAGVARSDQIFYLHDMAQFHSLQEILSNSPSWNRTVTPGDDVILYRPVLYLLMASFYYVFRYNFVAWQIASLCLHIAVVLGLHLLLIQGRLKHTLLPLLISLLFGTAFLGSELVLWNHIVGYVLFCALDVYAVYFFLRFLVTDRVALLIPCAALSVIAEFTYEPGAIVNLLFAATLLARKLTASAPAARLAEARHRADGRLALTFVLAALLLPIASLIDLQARGFAFSPNLHQTAGRVILLGTEATLHQIGFWMSAWLAPTVYQVFAVARAVCQVSGAGVTALSLLNLIALALLLAAGVRGFRLVRHSNVSKREPEFALALCMLFLFGYSMIIAVGRTLPRGWVNVISNIYYSYPAYLTVCVGIALAAAVGQTRPAAGSMAISLDSDAPNAGRDTGQTAQPSPLDRGLVLALFILVFLNACGVRQLAHAYRYDFAAPRQAVLDRVMAWRKQVGEQPRYFRVDPSCSGNEKLVWAQHAQLLGANITLADALWPEQSATLRSVTGNTAPDSVDEISCDGIAAH